MDVFSQIAVKIIAAQEAIIGPVAIEQATRVTGIKVDWPNHHVNISGDETRAIDKLVEVYKELFGQISVEVSKESAETLIQQLSPDELPKALK